MEELKSLEFLASNSKEIVEKQVDSYRQQHSYAGTIIGVTVLFIPFFLSGLDSTYRVTKYISIVPIALFIWSILLMLSIFRTKPLDQAFSVEKYRTFIDKPYKEILLHEIELNSHSYTKNIIITQKGNKRYIYGVNLTTLALLISIVLLLADQFIKIEKGPTKVQLVNTLK
jgi:predicted ferric reductase